MADDKLWDGNVVEGSCCGGKLVVEIAIMEVESHHNPRSAKSTSHRGWLIPSRIVRPITGPGPRFLPHYIPPNNFFL